MNPLGVDLKRETVILKAEHYPADYTEEQRTFYCEGGWGCDPGARGDFIYGHFLVDKMQRVRLHSREVEKIKT